MENGWSSTPRGVTPLSQWPPGRGRGFAPGRGRGWNTSSAGNSSSAESTSPVGVPAQERVSSRSSGVSSNRATTPRTSRAQSSLVTGHWGEEVRDRDQVVKDHKSSKPQNLRNDYQRHSRGDHTRARDNFNSRQNRGNRDHRDSRGRRDTDTSDKNKEAEQDYKPEERLEEHLFDHGLASGINFNKFKVMQVNVTGDNVPDKIQSFEDANLDLLLLANIAKSKYLEPTPIQAYAVPIILAGRDVMACAQTGSGKTAAFLLPIIESLLRQNISMERRGNVQNGCAYPEVVVMSPTRELAGQIKEEARKFCAGSQIRCVAAYGGTSLSHLATQLESGCNILVATPGRLLDFVDRGKLSFCQVKYLVLDEADRMLDMGFKNEMMRIMMSEEMTPVGRRISMMFSATFPKEIQEIAQNYLHHYLMINVGRVGAANTDVDQDVILVSQFEKREKLLEILTPAKSLVFVENKKTADFIASYLCQTGHAATSIHGDRLQPERESALRDFKTDAKPILVATAVAARGLDIRGVAHVINYDLPKTTEEYVHRIGRTGRLGNTGKSTSFYDSKADCGMAAGLVNVLAESQQEVPNWLEKEAKENPQGHFGVHGPRFGAKDIRNKDNFLSSGIRPTEEDVGWK